MFKEKRLVPERRFKNFKSEKSWDKEKLGNLLDYEQPTNYIVENDQYNDQYNVPVLTAGQSFLLGYTNEKFGIYNAMPNKPVIIFDDFTTSFHYVDFPFKVKSSAMKMLSLKHKEYDFYFIYNMMKNISYRPENHERHWISIYSLLDVVIPSVEEQKHVGKFFKIIDDLINLQQQKITKIKNLKAAYLTDMFPKEGEAVPRLRFYGFEDDWVEVKLSKFADKAVDNRGKTPPLSPLGTHPLIEVASLGTSSPDYSKVKKFLDEDSFNNKLRSYLKKGDILFSTVGSIASVSLMDGRKDAAIAQNIVAFRSRKSIYPEYLFGLFSNKVNKSKAQRIVMGAVQPSIKVSQLINVKYFVSYDMKEQRLIGDFFINLDNQIKSQEDKLEKLKQMKQAYLNEMFV